MVHIGVAPADLLLPGPETAYDAWAVIACDQFTKDRAYWDNVEALVGEKASSLRIVLPEIDLAKGGERLSAIHSAMRAYRRDVLKRHMRGMVYVRRQRGQMLRQGLIACIDLEAYDYMPDSVSLIRATEGTIVDRLPPRVAIREGAELESPHVLLLIDDPQRTVIEPLAGTVARQAPLYDFELMLGGGHITGYALEDDGRQSAIQSALEALLSPNEQTRKYGGAAAEHPLLFAVGDGNHSLATAKACWQAIRDSVPREEFDAHPARYALVEITNLQDEGLEFHPIHRVLFHVNPHDALKDFAAWLSGRADPAGSEGEQSISFVHSGGGGEIVTPNAPHTLHAGTVQMWLDDYLARHENAELDYIHGDAEAAALGKEENTLALLLPPPPKDDLFGSILRHGPLPRKTFSMGEALDKRYYLECRALVNAD